MNICEFCGKTFKTISSLNAHKKTTKYCLKIQKSLEADEIVNKQNEIREKTYNIENLKKKIKDYYNYIDQYYIQIENSSNKKCRQEYLNKIGELETSIEELTDELNEKIGSLECLERERNENCKKVNSENKDTLIFEILENDTEKLLDGHTEIKKLDSDSSKFARRVFKKLGGVAPRIPICDIL